MIVKGGTDYIMKNKFEILEQPTDKGHQEEGGGSRRFRTHRNFTHPIQSMVSRHKRAKGQQTPSCVYMPTSIYSGLCLLTGTNCSVYLAPAVHAYTPMT